MAQSKSNANGQLSFFGGEKQSQQDAAVTDYVTDEQYETDQESVRQSANKGVQATLPIGTDSEQEIMPDAEIAPEHSVKPQRVSTVQEPAQSVVKKKKRRGFFEFNYKRSVILNFILLISGAIGKMFRNSLTVSLFTSFSDTASTFSDSYVFGIFGDSKTKTVSSSLKKKFRSGATGATLPALITHFFTSLVRVRSRIYGYLLFSFGITSLISHFLIAVNFDALTQNPYTPITAIAVLIVAIIFIFHNKPLSDIAKESWILSMLFFKFLGIKRPAYSDSDEDGFSSSGACLIGVLLGALTLIFPAHLIIAVLLTAIYTFVVVKFPETGIISFLLIMPFMNTGALVYISTIVAVSYIFKILTGKRTASFEFSDLFVAAFLFLTFFSELISFGITSVSLTYTSLLIIYFVCICTLKDSVWFERAINSVILGSCVYTAYSLFVLFFGRTLGINIEFVKQTDLCATGTSVFTSSAVLGVFITCGVFFILSAFFTSKSKSNRLALFLLIAVSLIFTFLEASPSVIFALFLSLILYFVLISNKSMIFVALATVIIPLLPLFYSGVFSGLTDMLESESYRLDIWSAVINMLSKYWFTGIGLGENAFSTLYATYYVGNTTTVPHAHSFLLQTAISLGIPGLILLFLIVFFVMQGAFSYGRNTTDKWSKNRLYCYSGMCSVLAMFICGITEDISHNPRIFLLFFVMCALCVCARRSAKDTSDSAKLMLDIDENYI